MDPATHFPDTTRWPRDALETHYFAFWNEIIPDLQGYRVHPVKTFCMPVHNKQDCYVQVYRRDKILCASVQKM